MSTQKEVKLKKNMYLMTHRPTYLIFWKSFIILISSLQYEGLHSSHSYQLHYSRT